MCFCKGVLLEHVKLLVFVQINRGVVEKSHGQTFLYMKLSTDLFQLTCARKKMKCTSRPHAASPMSWKMDIPDVSEVGGGALVVLFDETCRWCWEWSAHCSKWRGV